MTEAEEYIKKGNLRFRYIGNDRGMLIFNEEATTLPKILTDFCNKKLIEFCEFHHLPNSMIGKFNLYENKKL